jgi:hypothetical protein
VVKIFAGNPKTIMALEIKPYYREEISKSVILKSPL